MLNTFTAAVVPATISAVGSVVAAILGARNHAKLNAQQSQISNVHELVNSRSDNQDAALANMTAARDRLVDEREAAHDQPPPPGSGPFPAA